MIRPFSVARATRALVRSGAGSRVSGFVTSSMPTIAPRPRMSPMTERSCCISRNACFKRSPMLRLRAKRPSPSMISSTVRAAWQATGLPPYVPPRPPTWGESMASARPVIAERGYPAARDLAEDIRWCHVPILDGEHLAGTAKSGLDFIRNEVDAVLLTCFLDSWEVLGRRDNESSFTKDRLGDNRRYIVRVHVVLEGRGQQICALHVTAGVLEVQGAAVAIGVGQLVGLRCEWPESLLVGHYLGGQAHGEQSATVEAVCETDDGVAARGISRNLDGVFHRFCTRVGEHGLLGKVTGGDLVHPASQFYIGFIHHNVEASVAERGCLLLSRLHYPGVGVANRHHSYSTSEIYIVSALDVGNGGVQGLLSENRGHVEWTAGDVLVPFLPKILVSPIIELTAAHISSILAVAAIHYTIPWSIMALATLRNPAILAPLK